MLFNNVSAKKLTSEQVKELRYLYFIELKSLSYLAKEYNVSDSLVYKVVKYETYKKVEDHHRITPEIIENRLPSRIKYSMKKAKRMGTREI